MASFGESMISGLADSLGLHALDNNRKLQRLKDFINKLPPDLPKDDFNTAWAAVTHFLLCAMDPKFALRLPERVERDVDIPVNERQVKVRAARATAEINRYWRAYLENEMAAIRDQAGPMGDYDAVSPPDPGVKTTDKVELFRAAIARLASGQTIAIACVRGFNAADQTSADGIAAGLSCVALSAVQAAVEKHKADGAQYLAMVRKELDRLLDNEKLAGGRIETPEQK